MGSINSNSPRYTVGPQSQAPIRSVKAPASPRGHSPHAAGPRLAQQGTAATSASAAASLPSGALPQSVRLNSGSSRQVSGATPPPQSGGRQAYAAGATAPAAQIATIADQRRVAATRSPVQMRSSIDRRTPRRDAAAPRTNSSCSAQWRVGGGTSEPSSPRQLSAPNAGNVVSAAAPAAPVRCYAAPPVQSMLMRPAPVTGAAGHSAAPTASVTSVNCRAVGRRNSPR